MVALIEAKIDQFNVLEGKHSEIVSKQGANSPFKWQITVRFGCGCLDLRENSSNQCFGRKTQRNRLKTMWNFSFLISNNGNDLTVFTLIYAKIVQINVLEGKVKHCQIMWNSVCVKTNNSDDLSVVALISFKNVLGKHSEIVPISQKVPSLW